MTENADGTRSVHITLHPDGVNAPALNAMKHNMEIVAIALEAVRTFDPSNPPSIPEAFFKWEMNGPAISVEELRFTYENWILSKAFQDLARGVRESLEQAFLFVELVKTPGGRTTGARIFEIQKAAKRLNFPDLLGRVNGGLTERLQFEEEFQSLQKVRNCLEHRNGVVGVEDVAQGPTRFVWCCHG
jgi:hypothetical protein